MRKVLLVSERLQLHGGQGTLQYGISCTSGRLHYTACSDTGQPLEVSQKLTTKLSQILLMILPGFVKYCKI
ncbi:unnamed protein product [Prunus armeniaca]